ncbi:MAG: aminotransferase [Candidatus Yonathbacteria bacterium CG_4_10_14_0_8_um_filter_47_645]|nr:MAG: aminotransferase [Candidatus Yonathbacteria bacterium CG_4_10_14_0_8_um_filter_47_645]
MRNNIIHAGADELTYEIREIVEFGEKLRAMGVPIVWENIGDPVAKGHLVPEWIKDAVRETVADDKSFGYSPTKGVLEAREFISKMRNGTGAVPIASDDILFFNGLGDAISIIYTYLNRGARVIGPNPAYPTHSSAEAAHAGLHHLSYNLNPHRNWLPDLDDLRNKVKYNPSISGILIINPDNPTGMVYPKKVLEEIIAIANEYDLFLISDEIYANIVYGDAPMVSLYEVAGNVPTIVMRGLSKEIPWPGSRCGWIEVYNRERDPVFARYVKTLVDAKMLEVCSTTLPQRVLPKIFSDTRYHDHLRNQSLQYKHRADAAYAILRDMPGVLAPKPAGAFYYSVVFDDCILSNRQTLAIADKKIALFIEGAVAGLPLDKRFVYYLMASSGICVVPLSGFNSELAGFRFTLLEPDGAIFEHTVRTLMEKIKEYLHS